MKFTCLSIKIAYFFYWNSCLNYNMMFFTEFKRHYITGMTPKLKDAEQK